MATILKKLLSESLYGRNILVTGVNSGELTTLHIASSGENNMDEIYLYAYNSKDDDVDMTLYWGGVSTQDETKITIPYQGGRYMIVDGKLLQNDLKVSAFCSSGSGINIDGYVNQFIY